MNADEVAVVVGTVFAGCPHQKINEYTLDAWAPTLSELPFGDTMLAVKRLIGRVPFIGPAEIRTEVLAIRKDRLDRTLLPDPPPWIDADNARQFIEWQRETAQAIADGTYAEPPRQVLPPLETKAAQERVIAAIDGAFQRVEP